MPAGPVRATFGTPARAFPSTPRRRSTCEEEVPSGAPASFITVPSELSQAIWETEAVLRHPGAPSVEGRRSLETGDQGQPLCLMCSPLWLSSKDKNGVF